MYIGLDLGTSSLKAILIEDDQRILAEHAVSLDRLRAREMAGQNRIRTNGLPHWTLQ